MSLEEVTYSQDSEHVSVEASVHDEGSEEVLAAEEPTLDPSCQTCRRFQAGCKQLEEKSLEERRREAESRQSASAADELCSKAVGKFRRQGKELSTLREQLTSVTRRLSLVQQQEQQHQEARLAERGLPEASDDGSGSRAETQSRRPSVGEEATGTLQRRPPRASPNAPSLRSNVEESDDLIAAGSNLLKAERTRREEVEAAERLLRLCRALLAHRAPAVKTACDALESVILLGVGKSAAALQASDGDGGSTHGDASAFASCTESAVVAQPSFLPTPSRRKVERVSVPVRRLVSEG